MLTHENIPYILGIIVTKIENIENEQLEIKKELKNHSDCLALFKLSKCKIFPWLGRNKYIVSILFVILSGWLSIINLSMDWITKIIR
jgi:hypothetical protein